MYATNVSQVREWQRALGVDALERRSFSFIARTCRILVCKAYAVYATNVSQVREWRRVLGGLVTELLGSKHFLLAG